MSSMYLGDKESLEDLESRMMSPDREIYKGYRHLRVESAFIGRIYVIYKPTGLNAEKTHKAPEVVGQIKVTGFTCEARRGCEMVIEDLGTGATCNVGFIPQRLFNYDVFVAVPPFQRLRWDGRPSEGGIRRSMAFGILLKTRTRSDFYSAGATMVESPKGFRNLYPQVTLPLQYC